MSLHFLLLSRCCREAKRHPAAMARMARRLWALPDLGRTEEQLACDSVKALEAFIGELGLPAGTEQLGGPVQKRLEQVLSAQNLFVYTA